MVYLLPARICSMYTYIYIFFIYITTYTYIYIYMYIITYTNVSRNDDEFRQAAILQVRSWMRPPCMRSSGQFDFDSLHIHIYIYIHTHLHNVNPTDSIINFFALRWKRFQHTRRLEAAMIGCHLTSESFGSVIFLSFWI